MKWTPLSIVVLAVLGFVAYRFLAPVLMAGSKTGTNATSNPTGGSSATQPDAVTNILTGVLDVYKGFSTVAQTAPKSQ